MPSKRLLLGLAIAAPLLLATVSCADSSGAEAARNAYAAGDYGRAIQILQGQPSAARDAAIQNLLAQCYYQSQQWDRAIKAAEVSVSLEPNNSAYHEMLGHAYGDKADRSGWLSALSLAKKARAEFATAVRLDVHNFSAMQALIEFDCSAPGVAGGGEDKARPEIARLDALDAAEGRYATGNCRRQKKDFAAADADFREALALHPQSADLVYDIGDYFMKHDEADGLRTVVLEGHQASAADPRGDFYRAVADTLEKKNAADAAKLFHAYLANAPIRDNYPSRAMTHYWLGRIQENLNDAASARREYQDALHLEPKNRFAHEALKRLQRD